jgi:Domain of unknown function (DUF6766)
MRRWVREQSLTLFFLAIFVLALVGQSFAGLHDFNAEQATHGGEQYSYWRFIVSSEFGGDVMENWQSEFLQFSLLILATVWFVQRGSTESKQLDKAGQESDKDERVGRSAPRKAPRWAKVKDWRGRLYENSLGLAMAAIFLGTWFAQSVTNWTSYNNRQTEHGEATVTWVSFLGRADFWNRTLQNWQSEFLAVATMAAFSIYLRQRGSAESKPVGAPHDETGSSS